MKKVLVTAAAVLLAALSGASAYAIVPGVDAEVGYGYNGAKDGIHSVHADLTLGHKVVVGAEARHWRHGGDETDVYGKYKIGPLSIGVGNRNYYDRSGRMFGLIEGRTNLLGPLDGYAGLLVSSEEREYKAGVNLRLVPTSIDLDLNYTYYDRDDTKNEDGFGVGLNYHF